MKLTITDDIFGKGATAETSAFIVRAYDCPEGLAALVAKENETRTGEDGNGMINETQKRGTTAFRAAILAQDIAQEIGAGLTESCFTAVSYKGALDAYLTTERINAQLSALRAEIRSIKTFREKAEKVGAKISPETAEGLAKAEAKRDSLKEDLKAAKVKEAEINARYVRDYRARTLPKADREAVRRDIVNAAATVAEAKAEAKKAAAVKKCSEVAKK